MEKEDQTELVKNLEARIHSLEMDKRITKIHSLNPKFVHKEESLDYLDGYAAGLEFGKAQIPQDQKTHAVAQNIPISQAKIGKAIGEVIDEDEIIENGGSDL